MASLALAAVGSAIGASIGGGILGVSAVAIGSAIGTAVGSVVDSWLIMSMQPGQRYEGQRLDMVRLTSATEGVVIPRVFGSARLGGNIIWATDFREEVNTSEQGGKGGGGKVTTTEYSYYASFAIAICEGPIRGVGRIWADGELLDTSGITWRLYRGTEIQGQDPAIVAAMGASSTPAYRGTAYAVFEDLLLTDFGNRIPQLTFEVFRPLVEDDTAEGMLEAVTLIPATGEFTYSTEVIKANDEFVNSNAVQDRADLQVSLDHLEAMAPNVKSVSVVVAWFGTDLRADKCDIRPGVETTARATEPSVWVVDGVSRSNARLVSQVGGGPVYGGTPSDKSVVQTIKALKERGYKITFYPFILMDVPAGNSLPNPYSDNAASAGQPTYPWRGRITCSPAAGFAGTVDKTVFAGVQVAGFFGSAQPSDFNVSGESVSWTGGVDWGYRRMVLHYAHLCEAAGGVDCFLIGSELRGLTTVRSGASSYPAVAELVDLAGDVRSIVGGGTEISYAADWTEYFGHHPADGSGDVFFHLDPLWADADIDFVGIDNYMPLSDWRDGWDHLDAQAGVHSIYDLDYLRGNVAAGEGFDWYYASLSDRAAQIRTPITDGAHGKPWVFRYKDLAGWWSNPHRNRPGGTESGGVTDWVPESKPLRFTEFGCPAVDRGTNQPNVFHDPKSSESFVPYFSRGWRDDAIQRAYLEATISWWADPANNPVSSVYGQRMLQVSECAAWTWDARPYPHFPALGDVWADAENWRLGHWLNGRLGAASLRALVRQLCLDAGMPSSRIDVGDLVGAVEGYVINAVESPRTSISMLARHFGFDACETEGVIRFAARGRAPAATISPSDMVRRESSTEVFEIVRGQESELPQALKWQVSRNDEEYDAVVVEARRATVRSERISPESFPIVVAPEAADRRCRRALQEAWVGRDTASFLLPPSRLALDPTDVLAVDHDGRDYEFRLVQVTDGEARTVEAIRQDRDAYDLPPTAVRSPSSAAIRRPTAYVPPAIVFLDVPILREDQTSYRPLLALGMQGRPGTGFNRGTVGRLNVWRSSDPDDGFRMVMQSAGGARIGVTTADLYSGPVHRFDDGNELYLTLGSGTLQSITETDLFAGDNAFALESAPGVWEILQAQTVELIAPSQYKLSRLLRGQRGTEWAMAPLVSAGATIVVLDAAVVEVPIASGDVGTPWYWRIGPERVSISDPSYQQVQFTPRAVGLEPFAGVHAVQPYRRGRTVGNLTIEWIRRSRDLSADIWGAGEITVGEESQSYVVDILDGAAVKRTLSSSTTSVVYTSAQQTADWGAALGPGASLDIAIYQIAPVAGRGFPYHETLHF